MNLAKGSPHAFHARCCKCIFWENIASINPSPLLWITDVDVSAVGVFMLSCSELRGLLVLVSFIHPRHGSHHMITPCWSLGLHWQSLHINGHEHITYITTLHYIITQLSKHAGGMYQNAWIKWAANIYLPTKSVSPHVTVFAWCPDSDADTAHMFLRCMLGELIPLPPFPLLQDPPLISSK